MRETGGVFTGPVEMATGATLTLVPGDPVGPLEATPKQYVDGRVAGVASVAGAALPLAGGTLTGPLLLAADPTVALQAATKQYADARLPLTGGVLTGGLGFGAVFASGNIDLSRHIQLHSNGTGFSVLNGLFNIVSPVGTAINFVINNTVRLAVSPGTAVFSINAQLPAAGTLQFGTTGGVLRSGTGAPAVSAPSGSLYLRTDGAAGTRVYVNQDGATTWAAIPGV
jgi:hypothetical protein